MPTAAAITHSVNSSREPVRATCQSSQGKTRRPTTSISDHEGRDFAERDRQSSEQAALCSALGAAVSVDPAQPAGQGRQQDEDQHHGEVFDHQPADRDAAVDRFEHAAAFQRPQQHHRARHRQGQAEYDACAEAPTPKGRDRRTQSGRHCDLSYSARQRDAANRQQVVQGKVQPDAEHQQHHPDLGELA